MIPKDPRQVDNFKSGLDPAWPKSFVLAQLTEGRQVQWLDLVEGLNSMLCQPAKKRAGIHRCNKNGSGNCSLVARPPKFEPLKKCGFCILEK